MIVLVWVPWELQSWTIALYMFNALDGVGRFRNISLILLR